MKIAPIRSQETHDAYFKRAGQLIGRTDQAALDELELLQLVMERWEQSQGEIPQPTPIEAIRFRMNQLGYAARDLEPYIGSRARVSEILSGVRPLSIDMIRALHLHLGVPAAALIAAPDETWPQPRRPPGSKAAMEKLRTLRVLQPRESMAQFVTRVLGPRAQLAFLRKTRTHRTNAKTDLSALEAWCAAVVVRANAISLPRTPKPLTPTVAKKLARLSLLPDGPARVGAFLRPYGVAFVTLDHLPGTYLDGAVLRRSDGRPVIALTLRYDRIDNFWFTLLHEYCHLTRHLDAETPFIVDDLEVRTGDQIEAEADDFARDTLIPLDLWLEHATGDMTPEGVEVLAREAGVNVAIAAGRWQRENGDYRRFAKLLGHREVRRRFEQ